MKTPGYELEQQRLQGIGQTPPVEVKGMAMPGPLKMESPWAVVDPRLNWGLSREKDSE